MHHLPRTLALTLGLLCAFIAKPAIGAPADELIGDYTLIALKDGPKWEVLSPAVEIMPQVDFHLRLVILPNGSVLMLERERSSTRTTTGAYSIAEGRLTITWETGNPWVVSYVLKNDILVMDGTAGTDSIGSVFRRL